MGDAADDAFDAAMEGEEARLMRKRLGIKRCGCFYWPTKGECPKCHDLGWLTKDGEPSEGY